VKMHKAPTLVFAQRDGLLRRELDPSKQIPYSAQLSEHVIRTRSGDYVQVFRLAGISFESADDEQLNNWHERLAIAWRQIASPNVALWTHVIRRRDRTYPAGEFELEFAASLNNRYRTRLAGERLMLNELYLSVVFPASTIWSVSLTSDGSN